MRRQDIPLPLVAALGAYTSGRQRRLSFAPQVMARVVDITENVGRSFQTPAERLDFVGSYGLARALGEVGLTRGVTEHGLRIAGETLRLVRGEPGDSFTAHVLAVLSGEGYTFTGAPITAHRAAHAIAAWRREA